MIGLMKRALFTGLIAFGLVAGLTPAQTSASKEEETLALLCKRYNEVVREESEVSDRVLGELNQKKRRRALTSDEEHTRTQAWTEMRILGRLQRMVCVK